MTRDASPLDSTRRRFLLGSGALLLTACADGSSTDESVVPLAGATATPTVPATVSSSDGPTPASQADDGPPMLTAAMFDVLGICTLLPRSTSGPYPNRSRLDRRDIHEGYPGHPLRLGLRVVDQGCRPVPEAVVEVWHTDASGDYSSYDDGGSGKDEGEESTFCRGAQTADANGIVEFETIYPGWYEGRAVHIHVTVHVGGESVRTGQLYLDEAYTEAVYANGVYADFGSPDTPWSEDRIVGDPTSDGSGLALSASVTSRGDGTLGLLNLGVEI